eukprot:TRINITY_DN75407_c0_g1_i1.p1 TRINITY_DN75407_c0_g1~~TRINITY_DN75407_c0_g1_i1.p1  ORF type:complete len:139 (+),score=9.50 TRINITY_DN75407_c0_g1_i1:607-1023(+)
MGTFMLNDRWFAESGSNADWCNNTGKVSKRIYELSYTTGDIQHSSPEVTIPCAKNDFLNIDISLMLTGEVVIVSDRHWTVLDKDTFKVQATGFFPKNVTGQVRLLSLKGDFFAGHNGDDYPDGSWLWGGYSVNVTKFH